MRIGGITPDPNLDVLAERHPHPDNEHQDHKADAYDGHSPVSSRSAISATGVPLRRTWAHRAGTSGLTHAPVRRNLGAYARVPYFLGGRVAARDRASIANHSSDLASLEAAISKQPDRLLHPGTQTACQRAGSDCSAMPVWAKVVTAEFARSGCSVVCAPRRSSCKGCPIRRPECGRRCLPRGRRR